MRRHTTKRSRMLNFLSAFRRAAKVRERRQRPGLRWPRKRPAIEKQRPETPEEQHPAVAKTRGEPRKSFLRRRPIASAVGAILAAAAMGAGYIYFDYTEHFQSTDDAFIASRQIALAPKVSGYVTQVAVTDNEHVPAGGVIARIDDRDYRIALEQGECAGRCRASRHQEHRRTTARPEGADQCQPRLKWSRRRRVWFSQSSRRSATSTWPERAMARCRMPSNTARNCDSSRPALKSFEASLKVQQRQIEALKAQRTNAEANLQQAIAQRDQAQLNLYYTTVTAASRRRVVNLTAAPGEFAQTGTNLTMFVPDEIWVTANFKENPARSMRPGQPVTLTIDAYPEREIQRPCRQRAARLRHGVLASSRAECDRQLRKDRAARAGKDRHRQSAFRCRAGPRHVCGAYRAGRSQALAL